jgi:hypothetical protein
MTAVASEVTCPKCGGQVWDNRATKTNPKAPDFKCRDRSCDGVIWPEKGAKNGNGAAAPRPAATTKQPVSLGPTNTPFDTEAVYLKETGAPPARADVNANFALYDRCFEHAFKVASAAKITDQQAIASMAATLYIQANK